MDALTVSSKVTPAKPVSAWRLFRDMPVGYLWAYGSPIAFIVAVVKLVFFWSHLSTGGAALYILIGVVAFGGLIMLMTLREDRRLECECPACGQRGWFEFTKDDIGKDPRVGRCDTCLIYVALRDGQVSEVPLETVIENQSFNIFTDQYEASVRRDAKGLAFEMPPFCAICGSADAAHKRKIYIFFTNTNVNVDLVKAVNYARTGSPSHGLVSNSKPDRISSSDFLNVYLPVCAQHEPPTTRPEPATTGEWGLLGFASYRFYKAFCVANHVVPSGTAAIPEARVRGG